MRSHSLTRRRSRGLSRGRSHMSTSACMNIPIAVELALTTRETRIRNPKLDHVGPVAVSSLKLHDCLRAAARPIVESERAEHLRALAEPTCNRAPFCLTVTCRRLNLPLLLLLWSGAASQHHRLVVKQPPSLPTLGHPSTRVAPRNSQAPDAASLSHTFF